MKPNLWIAACICAIGSLLGGCGGSGNAPRSGFGRVVVRVWRGRALPTVSTRLIPAASNAIQIELDSGTNLVAGPVTLRRPSDFGSSAATTFSSIPAGLYSVRATAYPSADSSNNPQGTPQASASVTISVTDGNTASASLTMSSTVASVSVTVAGSVSAGGSATASATAKDSNANTVLVAPGAWSWTSANVGIATVTWNSRMEPRR